MRNMPTDLTFQELKGKQREIRDGFPDGFALRIHRAISWVGRAEKDGDDLDAAFMFYWISFNAAYADERDAQNERDMFNWLFTRLTELDPENRLYTAVWNRFTGPIRLFLENQYVFSPFWSHHNGHPGFEDWQDRFDRARSAFHRALAEQRTVDILSMLFDRLYVLRNQLIHGGATWNSSVNRDQLRDGVGILSVLMPLVIDIMMDNPDEEWGEPFYPVVES
ncbi:hypothetical protein HGE68_01140 [Rhodobacteraceae bacterium R_SAG6]|nr:hypothetical protein [Rhodobacteraceae bacterium R_SAG6]